MGERYIEGRARGHPVPLHSSYILLLIPSYFLHILSYFFIFSFIFLHIFIYNLASKSVLTLLESIQNCPLRIALGAYHTSLKRSLCVEAAERPVSRRRLILTSNLLSNISFLPIYCTISLPNSTQLPVPYKHIRYHIRSVLGISLNLTPYNPYTRSLLLACSLLPLSDLILLKIPQLITIPTSKMSET